MDVTKGDAPPFIRAQAVMHAFVPREDITVFELASVIAAIQIHMSAEILARLPTGAQRHFERVL